MSQPALQISNIQKSFANVSVLTGITFDLFEGEVIALLGPSGCGKSTLLGIIAGIENPDRGSIIWKGTPINNLPPHQRGFGLMFQEDMLFPHLNVYENIAFGLKMQNRDAKYIEEKVTEILNLVGLLKLRDRSIDTLSGGEQQRIALARSIAPEPGLLMLDEPLSSLDRTLREHLLGEIKRILKELNQTAVYVTHDQQEAFSIADRIVLMRAGKVEQIGTPEEIYNQPSSRFAARFLGLSNLIPGKTIIEHTEQYFDTQLGPIPLHGKPKPLNTILIRSDSARVNGTEGIILRGNIVEKTFQGNLCHVTISVNGIDLKFHFLTQTELPEIDEEIQFSIPLTEIIPIMDAD